MQVAGPVRFQNNSSKTFQLCRVPDSVYAPKQMVVIMAIFVPNYAQERPCRCTVPVPVWSAQAAWTNFITCQRVIVSCVHFYIRIQYTLIVTLIYINMNYIHIWFIYVYIYLTLRPDLHISQSPDPSHPKWGPQQNGWPFTSLLTALNLQRSSQRLLHGPFKESTRDEHVSIAKIENDTSGRPSPM